MTSERQDENSTDMPPKPMSLADIVLAWRSMRELTDKSKVNIGGIEFEGTFEGNYKSGDNFEAKFQIASALIEDGRFPDPLFLLRNFIPPRIVVEQIEDLVKRQETEEKIHTVGLELKEKLQLLLVEKGHVRSGSKEDEDAQKIVEGQLERRVQMKDLVDAGWPIEVVGQIMTVELFTSVTDARKLEELRAWVTRALIRPYLGVLKGTVPPKDMNIIEMMDRVPKRIFTDTYAIRYNLVEHYLEQRLSRLVTDEGLEAGMVQIEDLIENCQETEKKQFLQKIYEKFYDIATFPLSGDFKPQIQVKNQLRPFPSFEQRTFAYDYVHYDTRLLAADTGLGKTNAAYLAMENSKAERVLVLAPASGKETWEIEANVAFREPDKVYIVKGAADLARAAASGKKYIVLSQELLGDTQDDPGLMGLLEKSLIEEAGIDGLIIDEVDNFNNWGAISTKAALSLVDKIRSNYQAKTGSDNAPVIALTATPIRGRLSNLNVPMSILYPQDYVAHHSQLSDQRTFSDTHLNRPDLVYLSLIGEKRMFRWEQATGVQEFRYEPLRIRASSFEEYLHDFIYSKIETGALNKIRLLEDALINPLLVKVEVRATAREKVPDIDIEEGLEILKEIASEWKSARGVDAPQSADDFLSADRLVQLGKGDLVLSLFLSDLLENGVDTLVEELTKDSTDPDLINLKVFWQSRELSEKYVELRKQVEEALKWKVDEDGKVARNKVFIISPSKRQGRTGDVLQRAIKLEDGQEANLYTRPELDTLNDSKLLTLLKSWVEENGLGVAEDVLMIDGTLSVGKARDGVISRWVNDPNAAVMLVTLESTYQSRDYTLNNLVDDQGREIDGVRKIFLGPPWHFQQLKQMIGRSQRQGQLVPVENIVLEVEDLIDQGKGEAVVYTYLLSRMALSGIVLSPEEQAFFDSKRVGRRIEYQSREARFMRDALGLLTAAGEDRMEDFFESNQIDPEKFGKKYFDEGKDEFKITGYNAELVSYLIKHTTEPESRVLSVGAGTLLLQRKLERGIDNVDVNPFIMEQGWDRARDYGGRIIVARASRLDEEQFPDGTYDFVDSAFALQMSKLSESSSLDTIDSERVKILMQINRVLSVGGFFALTLPEKSFDDEKFRRFSKAMEESFGFSLIEQYSGRSYGLGKPRVRKRLGWSVFMTKTGNVNLEGLDLADLEFLTDSRTWISRGPKPKRDETIIKDYPAPELKLNFDQFEIINPNNISGRVLISDEVPIEHIENGHADEDGEPELVITDEPLVLRESVSLDYLRGETKQDYREYRSNLIKPIAKITGWNWAQIEDFCIKTVQELQEQKKPTGSRLLAFNQLIREARKRAMVSREGGWK